MSEGSKKEQFLALAVQPEGISRSDARDQLQVTDQSVYSMAYALRQDGVKLTIGKDGRYHAKNNSSQTDETPKQPKDDIASIGMIIGNLPKKHQEDMCELLYEALYIRKVLEKKLEAHIEVQHALAKAGIHYA